VVFYAGVPVQDAEGHALGTLCVIDSRPREISEQKLESLKALAKLVNAHFELRKTKMGLEESKNKLTLAKSSANTIWNEVQVLVSSNDPNKHNHLTHLQQAADSLKILFETT
jgi:GAF domain-containing protein